MTEPLLPKTVPLTERLRSALMWCLPWFGVACIGYGVAHLYSVYHAAIVVGLYPLACEHVILFSTVIVRIWGSPRVLTDGGRS